MNSKRNLAALLSLTTLLACFVTPASAMTMHEAAQACAKNPKCTFRVNDNQTVDYYVGDSHVRCGHYAGCVVVTKTTPGNKPIPATRATVDQLQ